MKTASPFVLLPRELGQVPPPAGVVGVKARALCQLLTFKARVPRFGVVIADAFDHHVRGREVQAALEAAEAAVVTDDAVLIGLGEQLVRAVLRAPLSAAIVKALDDLRRAFADDDVFALRASVIGDATEADALAGVLEPALAARTIDDGVQRLFAAAFHPRTLQARRAAGLPLFQTRMAVVVQRMVASDQSGLCWSVDTAADIDDRRRPSRARVRACPGLAGGQGGARGSARVACDAFFVERPVDAEQGLADDARVEALPARKSDALRLDLTGERATTKAQPLEPARQAEASLSSVQARLVAREALRLEATFGRPQAITFAFANRLLHVLDVEPLLVPRTRVDSERQRTWDERLVPGPLSRQPSSTLTFSVWQRGVARGLERAGRLLGVRGPVLEDMRPQFRRVLGVVTGRITGNLEVLVALLDLLPFAEKAREAVAASTGQDEVRALKAAPPPGFWQRARVKIEEGRWPAQLERLSQVAAGESAAFHDEVRAVVAALADVDVAHEDPDALQDRFDELEEALGRSVAALTLSGMLAALYREDACAALVEAGADPALLDDLLLADDEPASHDLDGDVVLGVRRLFSLVRLIDDDDALRVLFEDAAGPAEILAALTASGAADVPQGFADLRRALAAHVDAGLPEGVLALEEARLAERPERVVAQLLRLFRSPRPTPARSAEALTRRRRAEAALEQAFERLGGLRAAPARKRWATAIGGLRRHAGDVARFWVPTERVVAGLRRVALALGDRLFEHGLVDQPKDIFFLQDAEVAGVIRGTAPDVDVRPLVAVRRRAVAARPPAMARRVETHGVVATSLLAGDDDADAAVPAGAVRGVVAVAGEAHATMSALDRGERVGGVVVAAALALSDLPLLAVADAVVAERGAPLSPTCHALRRLGIPVVVEAAFATAAFADGEIVSVGRGAAWRSSHDDASQPSSPAVLSSAVSSSAVSSSAVSLSAVSSSGAPSPEPPEPSAVVGGAVGGFHGVGTSPDAEARGRRPERPGDISGELAVPPAAGLHDAGGRALPLPPHTLSADGEPVHDDDVVAEEPLP